MPESKSPTAPPAHPAGRLPDPNLYLASERTLLAWIRTGLAMMGFGFVVARFSLFLRELAEARGTEAYPGMSLWLGTAIVVLGVVVNVIAAVRHARLSRRFHRGEGDLLPPSGIGTAVSIALAVIGFAMAVHLTFLGWP